MKSISDATPCLHSTLLFSLILFLAFSGTRAQTTVYTYTGQLAQAGTPANGDFNMTFTLFPSVAGGAPVGVPINRTVTVTNGTFSVPLDFGAAAFSGADRYLEVTVSGTAITPRTQVTSTPYAVRALTVTGPITGSNTTAMLSVSNAQPGITNPQPNSLPPAAIRGEATSTTDSNIGVLGVGNGAAGIGLLGITNGGGGSGGGDAVGVLALTTSTTGSATGLVADASSSPDGTAIEAQASATGLIFVGGSSNSTTPNPKIVIGPTGTVTTNGGVRAKNFFTVNDTMTILANGNIGTVGTIEGASLTTTGNVSVGGNANVTGTLNAANVNLGPGAVSAGSVTTSGNVTVGNVLNASLMSAPSGLLQFTGNLSVSGTTNVGGALTAGSVTSGGNASVGGTLSVSMMNAPSGLLQISSPISAGNATFGTVSANLLSGGDSQLCVSSTGGNAFRFCSSSLRYKKDIHAFTGGLDILNRLRPISFSWKENGAPGLGLGAEDVARVEPRLTFKNGSGDVEGVKYGELSIVLINAIKEQQREIESDRAEIRALRDLVCSNHRKIKACRVR